MKRLTHIDCQALGESLCTCRHENFQRNKPDLLDRIVLNETPRSYSANDDDLARQDSSTSSLQETESSTQVPSNDAIETQEAAPKPFVDATYDLVSENEGPLVGFSEDGTILQIRDPTGFADTLLPTYFKHKSMGTFLRHLNMYGFEKTGKYHAHAHASS